SFDDDTSVKEIKESINRRANCENHLNILRNQFYTQLECEKSRQLLNKRPIIEKRIIQDSTELENLIDEQKKLFNKIKFNEDELNHLQNNLDTKNEKYREKNLVLKEISKVISTCEKRSQQLKLDVSAIFDFGWNWRYFSPSSMLYLSIQALQSQASQLMENDDKLVTFDSKEYHQLMDQIKIDFSQFSDAKYSEIVDLDEIKDIIENTGLEIETLYANVAKTSSPNMKILLNYDERVESVNKISSEFSEIKQKVKHAQKEFEIVKNERLRLFMDLFNTASTKIVSIYKSICNDNSAQAYLTLDDSDEPYLSGVAYNCVPPKKGYQSIDKLSGGEKSLAALALLFALQSFSSIHATPFMILDEVDAAFDEENINNLSNYLRYNAQLDIPYVVISLKETLFHRANALIGVTS
ncbi:hypothetical protein MXB_2095, partial [Myxobolus squamalis]